MTKLLYLAEMFEINVKIIPKPRNYLVVPTSGKQRHGKLLNYKQKKDKYVYFLPS